MDKIASSSNSIFAQSSGFSFSGSHIMAVLLGFFEVITAP